MPDLRSWARFARAEVVWAWRTVGYAIRPYDMLAARRRWRWQPRQRCGSSFRVGEAPTERIEWP